MLGLLKNYFVQLRQLRMGTTKLKREEINAAKYIALPASLPSRLN